MTAEQQRSALNAFLHGLIAASALAAELTAMETNRDLKFDKDLTLPGTSLPEMVHTLCVCIA